jgi:circadian clock protein KaiC
MTMHHLSDGAIRPVPTESAPVAIRVLKTGIPGLDDVLGGGLPEFSFNLVAGGPGSGKTTLVLQFLFENISEDRPALFFTGLGEPTLKLLRHQQQFPFFDPKSVGRNLHFVHLGAELGAVNLEALLQRIDDEVARVKPKFVVVDSFRAMARVVAYTLGDAQIESFVQRLAIHLTTWEVTSFLVGEHTDAEENNPVFTVADGVIWLTQATEGNSVVRKLQVVKIRGHESVPGLHTFRIGPRGLQVYPRMGITSEAELAPRIRGKKLSTGIAGLDDMTDGGIPAGDVVVVAGPTGSGKTTLALQFALEGLRAGESVVVAGFEEYPREYLAKATALGGEDFVRAEAEGRFRVVHLRPLDLSVDQTIWELREAVREMKATRVVIDSLAGFENALAPTFRADFRESLHRLLGVLTSIGVTVMLTNEVPDAHLGQQLTMYGVSFLCDDFVLQRYVEIEGTCRRVVSIVKMRGGRHSRDIRLYEIGPSGIRIGEVLTEYREITTGTPRFEAPRHVAHHGLSEGEAFLLRRLVQLGASQIDALAADTGLGRDEIEAALKRMVDVGYATSDTQEGGERWTAAARMAP